MPRVIISSVTETPMIIKNPYSTKTTVMEKKLKQSKPATEVLCQPIDLK